MKHFLFELSNIQKIYNYGKANQFQAIYDMNLSVEEGEFISIIGRSGSGKSTLMNIIGMLDLPSYGEYTFEGTNVLHTSKRNITKLRRNKIGFVFQNFELISELNVIKNVELPMLYAGVSKTKRRNKALSLLESVGMESHLHHLPSELSGGQKQRVAIARALANDPTLLLADEPTGALDNENGKKIMKIFHDLHQMGKTVIYITHDINLASEAERRIVIEDGKVIAEE